MYNLKEPYNELPLLPPKVELETKKALKQVIAATRVLAELKGRADEIPNHCDRVFLGWPFADEFYFLVHSPCYFSRHDIFLTGFKDNF